ncbi:sulfite exporter TauE/SafE family protein [Alteromonadaceae bacterium BrNp21-10]|nr:sulfite exporter TauE/SafE family protein [Alteromonadaceae bacterium BrNp21-10]
MLSVLSIKKIQLLLLVSWGVLLLSFNEPLLLTLEYGGFLFLGVIGALVANATGAGGGVVFIPFFNQMELSNMASVATSFAIQCCGMTAGAVTWWHFYRQHKVADIEWQELWRTLKLTVPFSILGLVPVQFSEIQSPASLNLSFGVFSIILAVAIFATIPLLKKQTFNAEHHVLDAIFLPLVSLIGGAITAWLSVGVGELVAVYLIIRGFNIMYAVAVAVMLSAFTVWAAMIYHIQVSEAVHWQIWLFAGPGALIGGVLAKRLALYFSATNLKTFFAVWVLLLGFISLPI